jgi:hypothetical protein
MTNLEELIFLLDDPKGLEVKIKELSEFDRLDDEIAGFIFMYNKYDGNTHQIKTYLKESKEIIIKKKQQNSNLKWVKYAAIFIALIGTLTYFLNQEQELNYYEKYADTDMGLPVFMSINKNKLDNWMLDYKEKNYTKALKEGLLLSKESPNNDTINYYIGVIELELNRPQQAINTLKKITAKESVFNEKTAFLKAICLLDINKKKAKIAFIQIRNNKGFFSEKANDILRKEF